MFNLIIEFLHVVRLHASVSTVLFKILPVVSLTKRTCRVRVPIQFRSALPASLLQEVQLKYINPALVIPAKYHIILQNVLMEERQL